LLGEKERKPWEKLSSNKGVGKGGEGRNRPSPNLVREKRKRASSQRCQGWPNAKASVTKSPHQFRGGRVQNEGEEGSAASPDNGMKKRVHEKEEFKLFAWVGKSKMRHVAEIGRRSDEDARKKGGKTFSIRKQAKEGRVKASQQNLH